MYNPSAISTFKLQLNNLIAQNVNIRDRQYDLLMSNMAGIDDCFEELKLMLKIGVNPNIPDYPALYIACFQGALKNAQLLLEYNANPNFPSSRFQETPLIITVKHCRKDIFNLLLQHDVNLNYQDKNGDTALLCACRKTWLENLLASTRSDLFAHLSKDATREERQEELKKIRRFFVRSLLKAGANIDIKSNDRKTALDIAQENGFEDIVELLTNFDSKRLRMIKMHLNKHRASTFKKAAGNLLIELGYEEEKFKKLPHELLELLPTCNSCKASPTVEHKLQICGQCKKTYYCNRECQKKDWSSHKLNCKK